MEEYVGVVAVNKDVTLCLDPVSVLPLVVGALVNTVEGVFEAPIEDDVKDAGTDGDPGPPALEAEDEGLVPLIGSPLLEFVTGNGGEDSGVDAVPLTAVGGGTTEPGGGLASESLGAKDVGHGSTALVLVIGGMPREPPRDDDGQSEDIPPWEAPVEFCDTDWLRLFELGEVVLGPSVVEVPGIVIRDKELST
jgi:hypothetical protein